MMTQRGGGAYGPFASRMRDFAPVNDAPNTRIASYEADPEDVGRVLLLYSGGLDTSVMLHWIRERYGAEIVALTVNLGQPDEDWDVVTGKARDLGALDAIVVDAREEFARDFVAPAIKANALYGGGYPLFTALGRPLIGKLAVAHARAANCDTIAHGCTGKGNDQVRLEATIATLDPGLKVLAPVREWRMGREEEVAYAREHGIPVKGGSETPPYSIDDNLWGRSSEGGAIEDLAEPPHDDVFQLVTRPEDAPDEPELVRLAFEQGRLVSLDGERLPLVALLERAGELGRRHGVGIVDHIEDRIVGLKVRDLYEVPAAAIVMAAHADLERLVSTIHQNNFKRTLEDKWAYLCYAGLWWEPLRADLDAYMESANEHVTGEVVVKLYKGSATPVARSSPFALYDRSLAGFGESGGEFSQAASPGFIELFTLQTRMAHRIRNRVEGE
ncbi:MAG: argininosuccinate synthase [Solirubrobacterales bacterium]|nr:argininosuccinate synthase [Solirubrobacterales bacterium]